VLASGIDTLHLFTTTLVRRTQVTALEAAKAAAVETPRHGRLPIETIAGHTLTMERHGARTAPYLLDSEHMAVRVNPHAAQNLPSIGVELRALYLWQLGAEGAARQAQEVANALTNPPLPGEEFLRVSRIDLAVDFQGWLPSLEDESRFVTRAADRAMHKQRRAFTGFMFGRGALAARLYDKTLEIERSGKPWFREVWGRSPGYDPGAPVWRLEFQVKREALRAMKAMTDGGVPVALDTWPDALAHARALWRLLSRSWLALRLPRTNRTRQRLAPEWDVLHACGFADGTWAGTDADLYREARQAGSERTTAQLAGYLARGFAEHRFHDDIGADLERALPVIIGRARQHAERTGRTLETRASQRVVEWVQAAESIALGSDAEVHSNTDDDEDTRAGHGGTPSRTPCRPCRARSPCGPSRKSRRSLGFRGPSCTRRAPRRRCRTCASGRRCGSIRRHCVPGCGASTACRRSCCCLVVGECLDRHRAD
jgi:hypothetical protein